MSTHESYKDQFATMIGAKRADATEDGEVVEPTRKPGFDSRDTFDLCCFDPNVEDSIHLYESARVTGDFQPVGNQLRNSLARMTIQNYDVAYLDIFRAGTPIAHLVPDQIDALLQEMTDRATWFAVYEDVAGDECVRTSEILGKDAALEFAKARVAQTGARVLVRNSATVDVVFDSGVAPVDKTAQVQQFIAGVAQQFEHVLNSFDDISIESGPTFIAWLDDRILHAESKRQQAIGTIAEVMFRTERDLYNRVKDSYFAHGRK